MLQEIPFFFISVRYIIATELLLQQSYCYTQSILCNYSEAFVFKPISNQLNIFVGYNLGFTRLLNG